jgi:HEPN domain-containing protein
MITQREKHMMSAVALKSLIEAHPRTVTLSDLAREQATTPNTMRSALDQLLRDYMITRGRAANGGVYYQYVKDEDRDPVALLQTRVAELEKRLNDARTELIMREECARLELVDRVTDPGQCLTRIMFEAPEGLRVSLRKEGDRVVLSVGYAPD